MFRILIGVLSFLLMSASPPPSKLPLFPKELSSELPVLYKGRLRPYSVACQLWFNEISERTELKASKQGYFRATNIEDFMWKLMLYGHTPWDDTNMFFVPKKLRNSLGLNEKRKRFSYLEIQKGLPDHTVIQDEALLSLKNKIETFVAPNLYFLPLKHPQGEFGPLALLKSKDATNFTKYSDETFSRIKREYLVLLEALEIGDVENSQTLSKALVQSLIDAYSQVASTVLQEASGKSLIAPETTTIKLEHVVYKTPFTETIFICYALSTLLFFYYFWKNSSFATALGLTFLIAGFILHTTLLTLRIVILKRPPVSNMFESVIYVPWIAVLASICLNFFTKNRSVLLASSLAGTLLFAILFLTGIDSGLENVQAVLDSDYWLLIHVLMVVGSYGLFLIAGLLAHFYLILFIWKKQGPQSLVKIILQCMYVGVALLIPGTILGGIWAAESWGRFWDWDPKEAWAFISACVYLIWIHLYRYKLIRGFGLALGAVTGLIAITFTWYGVNYVLGTGLHSYGFGSGGEYAYYLFLFGECLLIVAACIRKATLKLN